MRSSSEVDSYQPNPYQHNPYQPSSEVAESHAEGPIARHQVDFVPILRRWEKFRLTYNIVLICLTLFLSVLLVPQLLPRPLYWMQLTLGGLVTNLCFFTGPALEGYGRYFRIWNLGMSVALFGFGLLFSCLLATGFVLANTF